MEKGRFLRVKQRYWIVVSLTVAVTPLVVELLTPRSEQSFLNEISSFADKFGEVGSFEEIPREDLFKEIGMCNALLKAHPKSKPGYEQKIYFLSVLNDLNSARKVREVQAKLGIDTAESDDTIATFTSYFGSKHLGQKGSR